MNIGNLLRNKLYYACIAILVIVALFFGLKVYAHSSFSNSVQALDRIRDEELGIIITANEEMNSAFKKMNTIFDEKIAYEDRVRLHSEIDNSMDKLYKFDEELITLTGSEKSAFRSKMSPLLSREYRDAKNNINTVIETFYNTSIDSKEKNSQEGPAVIALVQSSIDMYLVTEAIQQEDASAALSKAAPLQKYTRANFKYENEGLYQQSWPGVYDGLQQAKKLFADTYNLLLALNAGDAEGANRLWSGLGNQIEVVGAAIDNGLNEKNKSTARLYEEEISAIDKYIATLDSLKGIKYNRNREVAYYVYLNILLHNERQDEYPKVTDFKLLKQALGLKYGESDKLKYASSDDDKFALEYFDENKNKWITIDNMISDKPKSDEKPKEV